MKKLAAICLTFTMAMAITSCTNSGKKTETTREPMLIDKANWIIGEWANTTEEGLLIESWAKKNDSMLLGTAFFVVGSDTVSAEVVSIEQIGSELFYIPTIEDQNDGKPVNFKLTESAEGKLVFENPTHDYPQKITYTRISADSLVAEISGTVEGAKTAQQFGMKKK